MLSYKQFINLKYTVKIFLITSMLLPNFKIDKIGAVIIGILRNYLNSGFQRYINSLLFFYLIESDTVYRNDVSVS